MDVDTRNALMWKFFGDRCMATMENKGAAYAQVDRQPDANANFKRTAAETGVTPVQAWHVFFRKHADALSTWVRTGATTEGIEETIVDVVNYALILMTLLVEENMELEEAMGAWHPMQDEFSDRETVERMAAQDRMNKKESTPSKGSLIASVENLRPKAEAVLASALPGHKHCGCRRGGPCEHSRPLREQVEEQEASVVEENQEYEAQRAKETPCCGQGDECTCG